jgi:hypothetical protein
MNEDLIKSLAALIDESLVEIEELKKSDRFSASEIKLGEDKSGVADKDKNGSLGKEEDCAEKAEDDEEDEDKKKKEKDKMDKAEGKNSEADPDAGKHKADADAPLAKSEDLAKSEERLGTLMKSYIDDRVSPLEGKLESIVQTLKELAEAPVAPRGASYKNFAVLAKSEEAPEQLNKAQILDKLFELKKSDSKSVTTDDIISAEIGTNHDLGRIAAKYKLI